MLGKIAIVAAILFIFFESAFAEITLKNSFFGGWKFSTDGQHFRKIGNGGKDLAFEMESNFQSAWHMKRYKTHKAWANVTGWPSGFLLGWPLGARLAGGEWKDEYNTMIIAAVPLALISIIFDVAATRNLKKAVTVYNQSQVPPGGEPNSYYPGNTGTVGLAIKISF